jgi:DNA mismatch repair protein MutS
MYEEYIQKWSQYAKQYGDQTCLFYMVGKFYEMYDILDKESGEGRTNVKQAVETLGITLTTKEHDGPQGEHCLFAGFPEQSLQKFAGMLTREGWTVVVCDQEKNASGKVTGRPVARIFSPGTHIELAGAEAPYLAGIWFEETDTAPSFSAAVLDMTTGHLVSFESETQGNSEIWSADELVHFFQIHSPRETVIWWRGSTLTRPNEATFRRRCGLSKCALHLESGQPEVQGTLETAIVRKSFLEQVFSKKLCLLPILEQLHLRTKPMTERVLVCLLHFAEEHLPSAIQNLHEHTLWTPQSSVYMGNNTLSQLNYVATASEQSVLSLFQKCITSLGKRKLREVLLSPSSDKEIIEARLNRVDFFYNADTELIKRVESLLRMIHDIARIHRKISIYSVTAADILALDQSYGCIALLDTLLRDTIFDWGIAVRVAFETYKKTFESYFDIEKAKLAMKQDTLSFLPASKAPKTAEAEEKLKTQEETVKTLLESLRVWVGLPPDALRLENQEAVPYLITGTKTTLGFVKKKLTSTPIHEHRFAGITVHEKKSVRGSVEFSELDKYRFASFHAKHHLQQCVKEELPLSCNAVESPVWSTLEYWVAQLDVSLCLAKVAKERGYTKPEISEGDEAGVFALGLRHPLLESIQTRIEYVKHDVDLGFGTEYGWLLYGMNASGKSSLMKAIGVNVLLAQAGSFVPARVFKLKPFKSILTRILNQDSLWAGLSSFAVEISELRDIFQKADQKSLVLGDELCSGTESVSATSLVAAGIQFLHTKQTRFVFATHLHDLNKLHEISSLPHLGIWHLRVHYEAATDRLIYDRTLHRGPGGTLYGLEVARAMHLPFDILKQASVFRKSLLGEESLEESSPSAWNSLVIRKECELCKCAIVRELEVHHIQPRASAIHGKFQDGTSMNNLRNLIVVCQKCHDKHHSGELEIGPQKQTSNGPQRMAVTSFSEPTSKKVKVKWSEEELEAIEQYLRMYPHLSISRLVYDLRQTKDIIITESALRKIKNSLS